MFWFVKDTSPGVDWIFLEVRFLEIAEDCHATSSISCSSQIRGSGVLCVKNVVYSWISYWEIINVDTCMSGRTNCFCSKLYWRWDDIQPVILKDSVVGATSGVAGVSSLQQKVVFLFAIDPGWVLSWYFCAHQRPGLFTRSDANKALQQRPFFDCNSQCDLWQCQHRKWMSTEEQHSSSEWIPFGSQFESFRDSGYLCEICLINPWWNPWWIHAKEWHVWFLQTPFQSSRFWWWNSKGFGPPRLWRM